VVLVTNTVKSVNALTLPLVDSLVKRSQAKDKGVRLRCTQLLGSILKASAESDEFEIPEEALGRVEVVALTRCADRIPSVRVEACRLLELLQDPSNAADAVTKALLKLLRYDDSKDVRVQACRSLCVTEGTIPELVSRCRDDNDQVRAQVFKELAARVPVALLGADARAALLDQGLGDRNAKVRDAAAAMLQSWLAQAGGDVLALLEGFDVEVYEDVAARAVKALLEMEGGDNVAWPRGDVQDGVTRALVFRVQCEQAKASQREDALDALVADVKSLCALVDAAFAAIAAAYECKDEVAYDAAVFCAKQLLGVAGLVDVQHDQAGRNALATCLLAWLPRACTADELVDAIALALQRALASDSAWLNQAFAVIADLVPPELDADDVAELDVIKRELESLRKRKRDHVLAEEYEQAAALKGQEAELETRRRAIEPSPQADWQPRRVLAVLNGVLRHSKTVSAQTAGALASLIMPGFTCADALVRVQAVEALGLYSLLDAGAAASHGVPALRACVENADEAEHVRVCALKGLFDVLVVHGAAAMAPATATASESAAAQWDALLASFMGFLQHADAAHVAAQGLCKLLFCGRVADARVVQCLMVLLFHPSSESDPRVRQCLAVFFAEYALAAPRNQRIVADMALPTAQAVLRPTPGSMTEAVPAGKLLAHLVYLLAPVGEGRELLLPAFAEGLCREIAADAGFAAVEDAAKVLCTVGLDGADATALARLWAVSNDAANAVDNAKAARWLAKFRVGLEAAGAKEPAAEVKAELDQALAQRMVELGAGPSAGAGRKVKVVSRASQRVPRKPAKLASSDDDDDDDDDDE